jgi:hypothetical protein
VKILTRLFPSKSVTDDDFDPAKFELRNHQHFDFNSAVCMCPQRGRRLHVVKSLILMRERDGVTNEDRDVLKHAIEYIQALEREVARLELADLHVQVALL